MRCSRMTVKHDSELIREEATMAYFNTLLIFRDNWENSRKLGTTRIWARLITAQPIRSDALIMVLYLMNSIQVQSSCRVEWNARMMKGEYWKFEGKIFA